MSTTFAVASVDALPHRALRRRTVLVLNASNEPLRPVNIKRAVSLLASNKAVVHTADEGRFIRSAAGIDMWPWPKVIRLARYVYVAYEHIVGGRPKWTRQGVLDRDGRICAYCRKGGADTIDHITPRAQGGRSTWVNTVAACGPCNHRKADRTPAQAKMRLLTTAYAPRRGSRR